jgi:pyrophosphatase PpaX
MSGVVLFDLDGTLLDSVELILASYRYTLEKEGVSRTRDEVIALLGMPLEACFAVLAPRSAVEPLVATYREHNLRMHDAMARPYPGVSELVLDLAKRRKLGIVTSKRRLETERGLRLLGLDGCFEVLVCAGEAVRSKPDPAPVVRALELLGSRAEDAFFVGDSPHDVVAGNGAGVRTVAVTWGPFPRHVLVESKPTAMANDAAELERVLGR